MQMDFHYYATYAAAYLAGYSHDESLEIAYSAQLVDLCSEKFLKEIGAPAEAATVQLAEEVLDINPNMLGRRSISRIWASFHFLPYDLNAECAKGSKAYKDKYRLICGPNGELLTRTVNLAKDSSLAAVGIAMHVLSDTWAHKYFAGTASMVINNVSEDVYEIVDGVERKVEFKNDPTTADDLSKSKYINSLYQFDENSIMNLGHDRIGKLPDLSFAKYRYIPAWGGYRCIGKNNPRDYLMAFCQMIYAMKYLRGEIISFETDSYDFDAIENYEDEIAQILCQRVINSGADWKLFAERLSEQSIPDFNINKYKDESLDDKNGFMAQFIEASLMQKNMVAYAATKSGNLLLGNEKTERKAE